MTGEDRTFQGSDGPFHYLDWGGHGPLAVLTHASGLAAGAYAPFAGRLRPHLRVMGLDARGHGQTRAPADPRRLRDWEVFFDDLARFVAHLGEPVVFIGHSMGGMVSLAVAVRHPELVRSLVLIEPGILPPSWAWWVLLAQRTGLWRFAPIVAQAARRPVTWPSREAMREALRTTGPFGRWSDEFVAAYVESGTTPLPDATVRLCCAPAWDARCLATPPVDAWRYVHGLHLPTLLLYGELSRTFLPQVAQRFRSEVPHAVCHRFAGTGHYVPMEQPDEAVRVIASFLSR